MMISLGVDIGGTGCKCVAYADDGRLLSESYREYPLPAGTVDLPPQVLTDAVFAVIRDCAAALSAGERAQIAAVTVSSFGESFVAVDREGHDIGDILLYFGQSDGDAFRRVVEKVGEETFRRICRILPDAAYSLSKMLRTAELSDRPVWKYLFVAGYLCYRLSGETCTDVSLACRSLLFDVGRGDWSEELLAASGIDRAQLPQVVPTGTAVGRILPDVAAALGLPETTAVVIGAHDQIVNALGAGVTTPGEAADTSGTCECLTPLFAEAPTSPSFVGDNFATVPYLCGRGYVTYAYNISAGSVVRWFRDALAAPMKRPGENLYRILDESTPDGPTSLVVLPFLQGMGGTPDVRADATGLVAGLTTATRLPDLYKAVMEGITYEMRYNMERLAEAGVVPTRLYACGGGARSAVWLRIKADILGCDILPVTSEETGAMGSAILGLAAVTGQSPFAIAPAFVSHGEAVHPDPKNKEAYDRQYRLYKTLRTFYKEI